MNNISTDIGEAKARIRASSNSFDFKLFRDCPVLRLTPSHHLLMDSGFLVDKLDKGPFFTLMREASKRDREALLQSWGPAFETFAILVD